MQPTCMKKTRGIPCLYTESEVWGQPFELGPAVFSKIINVNFERGGQAIPAPWGQVRRTAEVSKQQWGSTPSPLQFAPCVCVQRENGGRQRQLVCYGEFLMREWDTLHTVQILSHLKFRHVWQLQGNFVCIRGTKGHCTCICKQAK